MMGIIGLELPNTRRDKNMGGQVTDTKSEI